MSVPNLIDRYTLTARPLPLPHTAVGSPSAEGWRLLREYYGITPGADYPPAPRPVTMYGGTRQAPVKVAGTLAERVPNAGGRT